MHAESKWDGLGRMKGFYPLLFKSTAPSQPFKPEPQVGCRHCQGTGKMAMLRFSTPCECLEPWFGWVWEGATSTVWYYNAKGEEIEVASVNTGKKPPIDRAVCVGRLCHYSRSGKKDPKRQEVSSFKKIEKMPVAMEP